ncbi:MAG TPA: pilus assembly protein TadG-related protein [Micrococcaceae bacterium]|nr:pilus assembly protein TadG-related protein [Micrococcaceae bacterium]
MTSVYYTQATADNPGSGQAEGTGEDAGQIMLLIIGYVLLTLLLVTAVAGASSVYLEHKKLLSVADSAAVAAADSYTLGQVVGDSGTPGANLSQDRVVGAVVTYLDRNGVHSRFSGLTVGSGTGTPDGRTAQVSLTAVVHPIFINFLVPDGIAITATSTARSQLKR